MNAKEDDQIARFIELRVQGQTLASIAEQLDVSQRTLIRWSRLHHDEIHNLRAIAQEAQLQNDRIDYDLAQKQWTQEFNRVRTELARRDLKDVPTPRLLGMMALLHKILQHELQPVRLIQSGTYLTPQELQAAQNHITWEV